DDSAGPPPSFPGPSSDVKEEHAPAAAQIAAPTTVAHAIATLVLTRTRLSNGADGREHENGVDEQAHARGDDERVEDLVVAEDARERVGPLRGVHQRAQAVRGAARDEEPDA